MIYAARLAGCQDPDAGVQSGCSVCDVILNSGLIGQECVILVRDWRISS